MENLEHKYFTDNPNPAQRTGLPQVIDGRCENWYHATFEIWGPMTECLKVLWQ